ncbi:hypothetical protein D3C75_1104980 [compost metagenome]
MAGHRHCRHHPLQLATGNLVRIALANLLGVGQLQHAVQGDRFRFGLGAVDSAVFYRRFDVLVNQAVCGVERGGGTLRDIGDTQATQFA